MNRKFKILLWVSGFVLILLIVLVSAAAYHIAPKNSVTVTINEHSVCKKVTNSGSYDLFVPTNTAGEWSSFRSNYPAGVSLGSCGSTYTLTEGSWGEAQYYYGYRDSPSDGSINPDTYNGAFISEIHYYPVGDMLRVYFSGEYSQDFFTSIKPSSIYGPYYTSSANYYGYTGGRTYWAWYTDNPIYDGAGTSEVTIA